MKQVQKGFTLIELMIVVAIIGILAAVAIPSYQDYVTKAKFSKIATTTASVKTALAMYAQDNGLTTFTGAFSAADSWTSMGLSGAPTTSGEVSAISVSVDGVITATVAPGVIGATSCGNVTWTPTMGSTNIVWTIATTCGAPAPALVAKWK
jgi:type IV pilus assembly protein PilA